MPKGNPDWTRDEHILALDLYLKQGPLSKDHPAVVDLSAVLNRLPLHDHAAVGANFRNPSSVYMKLNNFRRLDPGYEGAGLSHGSRGEETVWDEFYGDLERLSAVASRIRAAASDGPSRKAVEGYPEEEGEAEAEEGRVLYRLHRVRERKPSLVRKKKESVLKSGASLACEACRFDFARTYPGLGEGYIECHHTVPLAELEPGQRTRLRDLALLCSNCHRMVHHRGLKSLQELRDILETGNSRTTDVEVATD